jgi:hypothetical protein
MPAHTKEDKINLLPQKGLSNTASGRVLAWILSTFRIIVIVTEILVMVAFLSRFWLDAQNSDLKDSIEEKTILLAASQSFVDDFKSVQNRSTIFMEMSKGSGFASTTLETLKTLLPTDLSISSVTYSNGQFTLEGKTPNERSVQQLIVNLSSTSIFGESYLENLTTDVENPNQLNFKISVGYIENEGDI